MRQMSETAAVAVLGGVKSTCAVAMSTPVLRILVILPGSLVDLLHTLAALRALRESFPGARICAIVTEALRELMEESPDVDALWTRARQSLSSQASLWRSLREEQFDLAVSFSSSRHASLLAFGSGAPKRAGFADARWGHLLTHLVCRREIPDHEAALHLVQSLGCRPVGNDCRGLLPLSPQSLLKVEDWMAQRNIKSTFVVIAFHAVAHKNGAGALWEQTLPVLAAKIPVVLVGAPPPFESEAGNDNIHAFHELHGWSILAALCARAQVVAGVDQAVLHLAACQDVPVINISEKAESPKDLPCGVLQRAVVLDETLPQSLSAAVKELPLLSQREREKISKIREEIF